MAAFTECGWESELIVCDNNSTDRTAEIARQGGAAVVFEPQNQIARARNKGAEAATGDWIVFIDADSYPPKSLFEDVARIIRTGKYLFGGSTVKLQDTTGAPVLVAGLWNWISRIKKLAAGSFIFCETSAFREVKGFDTALYMGEELDLSQKLKRLAKDVGKKAIILHEHPLVTSARKVSLYSRREHFRFVLRSAWNWRRAAGSRENCYLWYDGRR
jgi:glycosyltransferase involved in cell wall biosynthesis